MRLGTLNVRTTRTCLSDIFEGSGDCAQDLRKTTAMNDELNRLNISIPALQETRLAEKGSLREAQYSFFWKGRCAASSREYGVGFAKQSSACLRLSSECSNVTLVAVYLQNLKTYFTISLQRP